jgi:hypothetical protein
MENKEHAKKFAYTFTDLVKHNLNIGDEEEEGTPKYFLKSLLTCQSNKEYKSLLTEHDNIMKDLFKFVNDLDQQDEDYFMNEFHKKISLLS